MGVTGKIGSTIAKNILSKSGIEVYGTVRSHKSDLTFQWKSSHIHLVDYAERYSYMEDADIIISATSSPHYTVVAEKLEQVLTTNKKRLFIDVAVPIDVDPAIGEISGVTLYDIDFFDQLSQNNQPDEAEGTGWRPGKLWKKSWMNAGESCCFIHVSRKWVSGRRPSRAIPWIRFYTGSVTM